MTYPVTFQSPSCPFAAVRRSTTAELPKGLYPDLLSPFPFPCHPSERLPTRAAPSSPPFSITLTHTITPSAPARTAFSSFSAFDESLIPRARARLLLVFLRFERLRGERSSDGGDSLCLDIDASYEV